MEFSCKRLDLMYGISIALKAVSDRITVPVIGNFYVEVKDSILTIISNNLEIAIKLTLAADSIIEGSVLIPAKIFYSIVSKLSSELVMIKVNENKIITIISGNSKFNIHGLPVSDFPEIQLAENCEKIIISSSQLRDQFKRVVFSVSFDESKMIVNGVYITKTEIEKTVKFVATDGFRLAKTEIPLLTEQTFSNIVPTKTVNEIIYIISNLKQEVQVEILSSLEQITFKIGNVMIISRVIQGRYPIFDQIIPKIFSSYVTIVKRDLMEACERCLLIASESANIAKFDIGNEKLHISAISPSLGDVSELIDIKMKGEDIEYIQFNIRLIIEFLKNVSEERIDIQFNGSRGAALFSPAESSSYIHVLMPIRTDT